MGRDGQPAGAARTGPHSLGPAADRAHRTRLTKRSWHPHAAGQTVTPTQHDCPVTVPSAHQRSAQLVPDVGR
jgi:hypothetical protein